MTAIETGNVYIETDASVWRYNLIDVIAKSAGLHVEREHTGVKGHTRYRFDGPSARVIERYEDVARQLIRLSPTPEWSHESDQFRKAVIELMRRVAEGE